MAKQDELTSRWHKDRYGDLDTMLDHHSCLENGEEIKTMLKALPVDEKQRSLANDRMYDTDVREYNHDYEGILSGRFELHFGIDAPDEQAAMYEMIGYFIQEALDNVCQPKAVKVWLDV